jgi:hypothetical protein
MFWTISHAALLENTLQNSAMCYGLKVHQYDLQSNRHSTFTAGITEFLT